MLEDRGDIDLPLAFLFLQEGRGLVWKGSKAVGQVDETARRQFEIFDLFQNKKPKDAEIVELENKRKLGIATLGALKQHPRISAFRRFIEGWYLSYFTPVAEGCGA